MPHCQEHQSRQLTDDTVVEEPESLVDIVHDPAVGVDVESLNVVTKLLS